MEAKTWVFTVETGFENIWDVDLKGLLDQTEDATMSIRLQISQ